MQPLSPTLDRLGLKELLASQLFDRVTLAGGDERKKLAERLSALYVELLSAAPTEDSRRELESRGRELLKLVPEADSYELRINLAKASYLHAEEIAERARPPAGHARGDQRSGEDAAHRAC